MSKPELEFAPVGATPYTVCTGAVPQLTERVLATDPETGAATRILRFEPHLDTSPNGVQEHDFWEEVYILEGSFTDLTLGRTFSAGDYACRPPGMRHGPWLSGSHGCLTFEVRYHRSRGEDFD
jgi:hypothetical protein